MADSKKTTVSAAVTIPERDRINRLAETEGKPVSELLRRHSVEDLLDMAQRATLNPALSK